MRREGEEATECSRRDPAPRLSPLRFLVGGNSRAWINERSVAASDSSLCCRLMDRNQPRTGVSSRDEMLELQLLLLLVVEEATASFKRRAHGR